MGGRLTRRIPARAGELQSPQRTANASLTVQPSFAHFGFEIVEQRVVDVRGVERRNVSMRKALR